MRTKNQQMRLRQPKMICNVNHTRYPIVRQIVKHDFKMKVFEDDVEDFDLLWCDHGLPPERIMRMKSF